MSLVIGLDLSLTRAGLAIWANGTMALHSVGHGGTNGASFDQRNRRIVSQVTAIREWLDPDYLPTRPDLAVIEGPIWHGPKMASDFDRAQLWGGVYSQLRAWRIPVAVVNNQTLKAFATGKGGSDKPAMLSAAREWCKPMNHDQADAAHAASLGALWLGDEMPWPVAAWRSAALERVEWPTDTRQDPKVPQISTPHAKKGITA